MGAYVENNLLPNEEVIAEAKLHWAIFVAPGILILLGCLMGKAGVILGLLGGLWALYRFMIYSTTELALTSKRVIAKTGIIRRNVIDVANTKVEGVTYHQGIIGRLFGYGSVVVRGTGVGQVPIPFIGQPDYFKQEVGRVLYA